MRPVFGAFSLLLICTFYSSCEQNSQPDRYSQLDHRTKIRLMQYTTEGKRLYNLHCANCHQQDGTGLARLYPPLKDSEYLMSNRQESICGIRHGQKGEIIVNGVSYNQEMPSNLLLTNLEIAEIATYVYTEFADTVQIITINEVRDILSLCKQDSIISP
jgi:cytochrome c551